MCDEKGPTLKKEVDFVKGFMTKKGRNVTNKDYEWWIKGWKIINWRLLNIAIGKLDKKKMTVTLICIFDFSNWRKSQYYEATVLMCRI